MFSLLKTSYKRFMNYCTDRPIKSMEEDLLGRLTFSNNFAKVISEYDGKDCLVIGLFGSWGTGKTSVINMALDRINQINQNGIKKLIVMNFSPWNYSDQNNLISLFFKCLKECINQSNNKELKNYVGLALYQYAEALAAVVLPYNSVLAIALKPLAKFIGSYLMKEVSLDRAKKKLEEKLLDVEAKIVVVIDDIDRLTNKQIRDLFQLVKQVADFPNVIYVLAMDRDIVCNALSEVHNLDGREYLDKIIQIPFEVPTIKKSKLEKIFWIKVDDMLKDICNEPTEKIEADTIWYAIVYLYCIKPYIKSIRDLNKLVNVFRFRYDVLNQEVSTVDLLGITAFEVLEPSLYKWIRNHKIEVCNGKVEKKLGLKEKNDFRMLCSKEFMDLGLNPEVAIKSVSILFPQFSKSVNENISHQYSNNKVRTISDEKGFDLYFLFDLEEVKVSKGIIYSCIYLFDKVEIYNRIMEINRRGDIIIFVEEITALIDKIPSERIEIIASVLLDLMPELQDEPLHFCCRNKNNIAVHNFIELVRQLVSKIRTEQERYEFIRLRIDNANAIELGIMAYFIRVIEINYERPISEFKDKNNLYVSLRHLEDLKKSYVEKIRSITAKEDLLMLPDYFVMFKLWDKLDREGVQIYLETLFKNKINILKFACRFSTLQRIDEIVGQYYWTFDFQSYLEYFSEGEVCKIIHNLDITQLKMFTKEEQTILASFVLNYSTEKKKTYNGIEVIQLVDKWNSTNRKS